MVDAHLALEKLARKTFRTNAGFGTQIIAVEEPLIAKRACVERLERTVAREVKKRSQLPAERQRKNQTASCQLAEGGGSIQDLQSKIDTATEDSRIGTN